MKQNSDSDYDTDFDDSMAMGDTQQMPSVREADVARSKKKKSGDLPVPGAQKREAKPKDAATDFRRFDAPRRMRVIRSSHSGCFGWMFGFVGLFVRMFLITALVVSICFWVGWQITTGYIDQQEVPVPNVRGLRVDTALSVVSENGMSISKDRNEPSALVAPGEIIDQKPGAGTRARRGAVIRVVVSGENEDRQKVPDVVGATKEEAAATLRGANLELGEITFIDDASRPAGSIISQTPEAGQLITDMVKRVDLLVSRGK